MYNKKDPKSIELYSKRMIGKTFRDLINENLPLIDHISETIEEYYESMENKRRKGGLGQIVEECFFHYELNNESRADFDEAGVELKVTPYKKNKNGTFSAKERLVLNMIDYMTVYEEDDLLNSHLWDKSKLLLIVYYLYEKKIKDRLDYKIDFSSLFTPPEEDLKIIKNDYNTIINKIKSGKAHELSGSDTLYLEAATKASSSSDRRKQPFSDELAKPRAFAYKQSYMTYVLNNYFLTDTDLYNSENSIIKNNEEFSDFEKFIISKVDTYKNWSIDDIKREFSIESSAKSLNAMLLYRILGVKGNHAEEFKKAGIRVKTIKLDNKGRLKESMSFPHFEFTEIIKQDWEESDLYNYLSETRFLFVVFKEDSDGITRLSGCQFWNMPYNDLNIEVKSVWEKTKDIINTGIKITTKGKRKINNFPKKADNPVSHVRPHGKDSSDVLPLPNGGTFTKQSFWLNNTYILSQLENRLK